MSRVTENPPVFEARQISEDEDSSWVLVNENDESDVKYISNEEYKARYTEVDEPVDPFNDVTPVNEEESDDNV